MGKVHVIKFQGMIEREERVSALQYRPKFVDVENWFYLKYFRHARHAKDSDFFDVSDTYWESIIDCNEFKFEKIVRVVGYSTDVPLVLNTNGRDQSVLMPNYAGTPEILPTDPLSRSFAFSPYENAMTPVLGIAAGTTIKVKEGR